MLAGSSDADAYYPDVDLGTNEKTNDAVVHFCIRIMSVCCMTAFNQDFSTAFENTYCFLCFFIRALPIHWILMKSRLVRPRGKLQNFKRDHN